MQFWKLGKATLRSPGWLGKLPEWFRKHLDDFGKLPERFGRFPGRLGKLPGWVGKLSGWLGKLPERFGRFPGRLGILPGWFGRLKKKWIWDRGFVSEALHLASPLKGGTKVLPLPVNTAPKETKNEGDPETNLKLREGKDWKAAKI